jgi:hypothetical protein
LDAVRCLAFQTEGPADPQAPQRLVRAAQAVDGAYRRSAEAMGQNEGRVVGEYASGNQIDDVDDTFTLRFLYAFWRLSEQRIASIEPVQTNHAARVIAEWWLPNVEVIPTDKAYKYVKTADEIRSTGRPLAEVRETYRRLVSQIALRALHTIFTADPYQLVGTVVFNGMVEGVDPSTGQQIESCLITLRATRDQFTPLVLSRRQPN